MMNELEKAYMTMQVNCNIKNGDTVKVLRKANDKEQGWPAYWNDGMDFFVGETRVVSSISENGYCLDGASFSYPWFVLEKIPKPHWRDTVSPENPVLCYVKDFENQEWSERIFLVGVYEDQEEKSYSYNTGGNVYKYAKRVPKSVIESMLKAYDETSEDE